MHTRFGNVVKGRASNLLVGEPFIDRFTATRADGDATVTIGIPLLLLLPSVVVEADMIADGIVDDDAADGTDD